MALIRCPLTAPHLRRITTLSGPIWDRANRVAQACHLERIVANPQPPNWPYRRFDRSPLSVPLETTVGAPQGREGFIAKGGRTDRWPQITAIPSRTILILVNIQLYDGSITASPQPYTASPILLSVRVLEPSPDPGPQFSAGSPAPSCERLTQPRNCPVAVVPDSLEVPGRRIGQRGDAT